MNKGTWHAIGAYVLWGFFPVYFKWLRDIPALQVIGHRIIWSCLMLCAILLLTRQWSAFRAHTCSRRIVLIYLVAAILISINWLVFVWAINANFIVEVSLGYFLSPIVNVLMGVLFLRERLRPWQWLSVGLVAAGVLYLTFVYGRIPWVALTLALSFGVYGLVKKTAPLRSLNGLTLETAILFVPALLYLLYCNESGQGSFLHSGTLADVLMVGSGVATAIPLLLFASASQRIPLWQLGILQYIAPTLQFILGTVVYKEPSSYAQLGGFGLIWAALIIFALEGFIAGRAQALTAEA
jgi:chloramphenicol-sensitive protein RarD